MGVRVDRGIFSRIEVAHAAALSCATDFTLELVGLRIDTAPTTDQIFGLALKGSMDGTTTCNFGLWYRDEAGVKKLYGGFWASAAARLVTATMTLTPDAWYYVALRWDDTAKELNLYTGLRENDARLSALTLQATASHLGLSPSTNSQKLFIGCDMSSAGFQTNGSYATFGGEIRLAGSALSQSTLEAQMNLRLQGQESTRKACWSLDEGTGLVTRDLAATARTVAGGNNGTLTNGALWADDPQDVWYGRGWGTPASGAPIAREIPPALIGFCSHTRRQGSTITASDEAAGYEAKRLRAPRGAITTRTANVTGTKTWVIDFGQPVVCGAVVITNPNFTSAAVLKCQLHTADSWAGPAIDVSASPTLGVIVVVFRRQYGYRYFRFTALDAANPDGYLEMGTLDVFPLFESEQPMDAGLMSLEHIDESPSVVMQHQHQVFRSLASRTDLSLSVRSLYRGQAGYLHEILTEAGGGDPLWIAYDARRGLMRSAYGTLTDPGADRMEEKSGTRWAVEGVGLEVDVA